MPPRRKRHLARERHRSLRERAHQLTTLHAKEHTTQHQRHRSPREKRNAHHQRHPSPRGEHTAHYQRHSSPRGEHTAHHQRHPSESWGLPVGRGTTIAGDPSLRWDDVGGSGDDVGGRDNLDDRSDVGGRDDGHENDGGGGNNNICRQEGRGSVKTQAPVRPAPDPAERPGSPDRPTPARARNLRARRPAPARRSSGAPHGCG